MLSWDRQAIREIQKSTAGPGMKNGAKLNLYNLNECFLIFLTVFKNLFVFEILNAVSIHI